jgi:hypothetical protein
LGDGLVAVVTVQVRGVAINGASGGPLSRAVNEQGMSLKLVGVLSAYISNVQVAQRRCPPVGSRLIESGAQLTSGKAICRKRGVWIAVSAVFLGKERGAAEPRSYGVVTMKQDSFSPQSFWADGRSDHAKSRDRQDCHPALLGDRFQSRRWVQLNTSFTSNGAVVSITADPVAARTLYVGTVGGIFEIMPWSM